MFLTKIHHSIDLGGFWTKLEFWTYRSYSGACLALSETGS
jgi:hypothetical protein